MNKMFSKLDSNAFALVLLPMLFIPVIFYDTTLAMVRVWAVNETFTHGFLVLPLVIWLILQKKSQISSIEPVPEPWAFGLLLLLLTGWLVGAAVDVEIVQQFFMVTIILISIWIAAGRQVLFYVLFPLMFLYFAVPFGQVLIHPLMLFTADFTVALIKMVGIPVYRDGLSFTLPTGSWSVVEECSGVRYLIASFLLGSIYAYLNYSSIKKRVIFILLSLVVPIIGNSLRAFGIVIIGHFSGMKLAIGIDHLVYGWVFFGFIIFLLFYAGSFWWDDEESFGSVSDEKTVATDNQKKYPPSVLLMLTFFLMALFSVFSNHIEDNKQRVFKHVAFQLPRDLSGWRYDADRSLGWQPVIVNPDVKISRGYVFGDDFVQLDIAYYQTQRQGAEAVSTSNRLANPYSGDWKLVSSADVFKSDRSFIESELKRSGKKLLIWSWYRVGKYETSSPYMAKIFEAYNLIIEGRSDVSMLSIATRFDDAKKVTRQKLYDFWEKSGKDIADSLEQIRSEQ